MHSTADTSPTTPVSRHVPQPKPHPFLAFLLGMVNVLSWTAFVLFWPFMILAALLPLVVVVVLVLMLFDVLPSGSFLAVVLATVGTWIVSWTSERILSLVSTWATTFVVVVVVCGLGYLVARLVHRAASRPRSRTALLRNAVVT